MLSIQTKTLGKKYQLEWIFRNVSLDFEANQTYTIIGPNGSGKSTLLKVLSGAVPANQGEVIYHFQQNPVRAEEIYRHLSMAAPYLELIEEFTLKEAYHFHHRLKPFSDDITFKTFLERTKLEKAKHKLIRYFSSGMKQRLKLAFAFFSQTPLLLLDEPTTNLDQQGVDWYLEEIHDCLGKRLIFIGSNQPIEYSFCKQLISIVDYKK